MDELLKKLLEAEILTEGTREELQAAFKKQLDEAVVAARAEAQASVSAELTEQWVNERETLIEALDAKVTEALAAEIKELTEDIERFRDLEAEYAEKLVEAKADMARVLKGDMAQLIEKLNTFLEVRLTAELDELREDLLEAKRNQFGKQVFESFVSEFKKHYAADGSVESKLNETERRLEDATAALKEAEQRAAKLERTIKLEKVLAPLSGRSKEVMEAILKTVDTPMLEDAYNTYIGRVLKESTTDVKTSGKETKVLAEGEKKGQVAGIAKSGDDTERLMEEAAVRNKQIKLDEHANTSMSAETKKRIRSLAGMQ